MDSWDGKGHEGINNPMSLKAQLSVIAVPRHNVVRKVDVAHC